MTLPTTARAAVLLCAALVLTPARTVAQTGLRDKGCTDDPKLPARDLLYDNFDNNHFRTISPASLSPVPPPTAACCALLNAHADRVLI